jgi:hypothetical protein
MTFSVDAEPTSERVEPPGLPRYGGPHRARATRDDATSLSWILAVYFGEAASDVRERRSAGRVPPDLQRDRRTDRALPIVFTAVGFILGPDGLGALSINLTGEGLRLLAELTLAMVLFTDAANADFTVVRSNLGLPERLLGLVCH